jgi:formate-dependent nitrite reductase membrane component NrfD
MMIALLADLEVAVELFYVELLATAVVLAANPEVVRQVARGRLRRKARVSGFAVEWVG